MAPPTIQQLFDLSGKVALVTGGARNLGRDAECALAEAGADVAITSRSLEPAQTHGGQYGPSNAANDVCRPPVEVEVSPVLVDGRTVVGMRMERSVSLHSHADGRVLMRVGSQDKRLLGADIHRVALAKCGIR